MSLANFALIFGLRKTNKNLTLSQKLYIYLSANDMMVGFVGLPYFIVSNLFNRRSCLIDGIGLAISGYVYSMSHCTFLVISYLRNLAIRKPLVTANPRTIKMIIICCNIFMLVSSTKQFFLHNPDYNSISLFITLQLYSGIWLLIAIVGALSINIWSRNILNRRRSNVLSGVTKERINKRNQTAVSILNQISLVIQCMWNSILHLLHYFGYFSIESER